MKIHIFFSHHCRSAPVTVTKLLLHYYFFWWITKKKLPHGMLVARNGNLMTKWPLQWAKFVFQFVRVCASSLAAGCANHSRVVFVGTLPQLEKVAAVLILQVHLLHLFLILLVGCGSHSDSDYSILGSVAEATNEHREQSYLAAAEVTSMRSSSSRITLHW